MEITKLWTDEQLKAGEFIPKKIGKEYITFLLELSKCIKCKKDMIRKPKDHRDTFPYWFKINFDAQAERAKLVIQSNVIIDDHYICIKCVKKGKVDFLCALCETRKPTNKIEESFGYPPEFLCTDCFITVTAVEWTIKSKKLYEDHRYDCY